MRKILIIEDEPLAVDKLREFILKFRSDYELLEDIDSVEYAIEWLQNNPEPDLIFVDIQLADGLSFDIFKQVKLKAPLIFVTAYDNYAIQAFKQNSIDYILKPFEYEDLRSALDRFEQRIAGTEEKRIDIAQLQAAMEAMANRYKRRFVVKSGDKILSIETDSIQAFLSEDKYTMLVDEAGKKHFVQYRLEQLKELLDPRQFYRINRKYVINVSAIKEVLSYSGNRLQIVLKQYDRDDLVVSREKVASFRQWLNS